MTSDENVLVKTCQESEGAEFERAYSGLFDLYQNRVFTICLRVTGNQEDAMDAAQETMVTLARRIQNFQFRSRFSSWVYRIAVNAAIDVRRRRLTATRAGVTTMLADVGSDSPRDPAAPEENSDPSVAASGRESQAAIRKALLRINPKFSSLLTLRYIQGLAYEEISEVLECSLGTVKSRLSRAHAALRTYLERQGGMNDLL
ncbi:MAG: sigma-70 family RNA polymerase sigma factor [Planctomycetes bacterium]|nr:sigma-70 family RNA polymerase sigma factor [Planctomycetota bacterium]